MDEQAMRLVERDGRAALVSPGVGLFTCALPAGAVLTPGLRAGVLTTLGRPVALVVPPGARGVVTSERPELVRAPVGYGSVLYELAPLEADARATGEAPPEPVSDALVVRAPSSGRFYRRPAPDAPCLVDEGDTLEEGRPIGLIEIMKTFHHVHYRAAGVLPHRARLVRFLAPDGGDVHEGDALIEVAPA
jgi:acetyl-CoA carboxylase biotin carboxyl carrier protein